MGLTLRCSCLSGNKTAARKPLTPPVLINARHLVAAWPEDPDYAALLAWKLAASPFPSLRNTEEAISVGSRTAAIPPENLNCWTALALAQCRRGDFDEASRSLEKAIELKGRPGPAQAVIYALVHCGRRNLA